MPPKPAILEERQPFYIPNYQQGQPSYNPQGMVAPPPMGQPNYYQPQFAANMQNGAANQIPVPPNDLIYNQNVKNSQVATYRCYTCCCLMLLVVILSSGGLYFYSEFDSYDYSIGNIYCYSSEYSFSYSSYIYSDTNSFATYYFADGTIYGTIGQTEFVTCEFTMYDISNSYSGYLISQFTSESPSNSMCLLVTEYSPSKPSPCSYSTADQLTEYCYNMITDPYSCENAYSIGYPSSMQTIYVSFYTTQAYSMTTVFDYQYNFVYYKYSSGSFAAIGAFVFIVFFVFFCTCYSALRCYRLNAANSTVYVPSSPHL